MALRLATTRLVIVEIVSHVPCRPGRSGRANPQIKARECPSWQAGDALPAAPVTRNKLASPSPCQARRGSSREGLGVVNKATGKLSLG